MKNIKVLAESLPVGEKNYLEGEIVAVPDNVALAYVAKGLAEEAGNGTPANEDHNPLADVLDPVPPGGPVIHPALANTPKIDDNPGLAKQIEVVGVPSGEDASLHVAMAPAPRKRGPRTASNAVTPDTE